MRAKEAIKTVVRWVVGITAALALLYVNGGLASLIEACAKSAEPQAITEPQEVKVVWEEKVVIEYEPIYMEGTEKQVMPENMDELEDFIRDMCLVAQTLWGEARGMSTYEQSLVAWCIMNRVDSPQFPNTIEEVIKQSGQFHGYSPNYPIDAHLFDVAQDVICRWKYEPIALGNIGRTLPKDYLYFYGKDGHNKYRKSNSGAGIYDFTDILPNPYSE